MDSRRPEALLLLLLMLLQAFAVIAFHVGGAQPSTDTRLTTDAMSRQRLKGGQLYLRGGRREQHDDEHIREILAARERGPNSITSECVFYDPAAPARRKISAGMLEAIRDFADMPMCNQSIAAFDSRIHLSSLLIVVNGSADGTPIEPVGAQALAARALHKLFATATSTRQLAELCAERTVSLHDAIHVLLRPLAHEDPQIKWHLLDIVGLLSRDSEGIEMLINHEVMPVILRCLWDGDTDVVLRTGRIAATLARVPSGLSALFSGCALEIISLALNDDQLHIR